MMNKQQMKFLPMLFFCVLLTGAAVSAQSLWLDQSSLTNWNERGRAIVQTAKVPAAALAQCRSSVRPATLAPDRLLTRAGWTLVGPAQIYGRTSVVTAAKNFDGMCRPLGFQTFVFVGNRVAGTLSPAPMDSRTDGALSNVRLFSETMLAGEYVRYRDSDALCCPSKTESISFRIRPDGANFLLVPEAKTPNGVNAGGQTANGAGSGEVLKNSLWRWESLQTPVDKITVANPERYTLEFTSDGKLNVRADCNRGRGTFRAEENTLAFSGIVMTRAMCPSGSLDARFLRGLEGARVYRIEGDRLRIDLFADSGTMHFARVK